MDISLEDIKAKVIFKEVQDNLIYFSPCTFNLVFDNNDKQNTDCAIFSNNEEFFESNKEYEVIIEPLRYHIIEPYLEKGIEFIGRHGSQIFLEGKLISTKKYQL